MNPNEAILVFGDVGGYVNALFFNSAQIALFERPPAPAGEKQGMNIHKGGRVYFLPYVANKIAGFLQSFYFLPHANTWDTLTHCMLGYKMAAVKICLQNFEIQILDCSKNI